MGLVLSINYTMTGPETKGGIVMTQYLPVEAEEMLRNIENIETVDSVLSGLLQYRAGLIPKETVCDLARHLSDNDIVQLVRFLNWSARR